MKRILVTGAEGFVGRHLTAELRRRGQEVFETIRPPAEQRPDAGAPPAPGEAASRRHTAEFPDRRRLEEVLAAVQPDAVVHLAALSFVPQAEADPAAAVSVNVEGTRSLLEALDASDPRREAALILVSTAQVYRPPASGDPIDEDCPVQPANAYGRSKLAAELVAQCLAAPAAAAGGISRPLIIFRPFNHSGPGQSPRFAIANFARQIARVEAGLQPPEIRVGDLDVERDFTDVRDVVRAYSLAAEGRVPPGTYNLASGRAVSLRSILDMLKRLSSAEFSLQCPDSLRRAGEVHRLAGSAEKLRRVCAWTAEIPRTQTLGDSLDWWRAEMESEKRGERP